MWHQEQSLKVSCCHSPLSCSSCSLVCLVCLSHVPIPRWHLLFHFLQSISPNRHLALTLLCVLCSFSGIPRQGLLNVSTLQCFILSLLPRFSRSSWNLVWSCLDPIPPLHLQQVHFRIHQSLWFPLHTGRCWVLPLRWFKWFSESLTTSLDETLLLSMSSYLWLFSEALVPGNSVSLKLSPWLLSRSLESLCLLYLVLPGSRRCLELSVSRPLSFSSMRTVSYNSFIPMGHLLENWPLLLGANLASIYLGTSDWGNKKEVSIPCFLFALSPVCFCLLAFHNLCKYSLCTCIAKWESSWRCTSLLHLSWWPQQDVGSHMTGNHLYEG